ncbi:MAG: site-specific integrase [Desulfobacteraceae bacterium]|nr:site-specific integrase [Desulfobacteraceae bacterium]
MEWQKEQSRLEQDPGATPKKEYKKIPVDPGKCCNRYKRELRTFFNYYKHDQVIQINPADAVNDFDEIEFEKYVPPGEDIEAIKKVSTQDELDLIRTLIHTGARAGEIRNMQYTDFNETVNKLTLWTTKRQGSKKVSHIMEVGKELKKIFIRRIKNNKKNYPWIFPSSVGEQMPKDSLDNLMPRLCKRVIKKLKKQGVKDIKFKEFTMHSIRHYMAVQIFLREGLAKTQVFLRHKRATTTDIYIKSILNIESISAPITDDIEKSMNSSSIQSQIVPLFKGKNM